MKNSVHRIISTLSLSALFLLGRGSQVSAAQFSSKQIITFAASVTVGAVSGGALTIQAASLPSQAFFGKNLMVPVKITSDSGPVNTNNLRVDIVYQLTDASGQALSAPTSVPIQFIPGTASGNTLSGTAIINRSDLALVQNGGTINYVFSARQGASSTVLGAAGISQIPSGGNLLASPFKTTIINQLCTTVGPSGAKISAPDLVSNDGRTAVSIPQGAVAAAGSLCIQRENADAWPAGPGGSKPAAIYSIHLQDAVLAGTAELALSYPADLSGKVLDLGSDAGDLGIYWLDLNAIPHANGVWRPLSRATVDTTLHTVTGTTSHFSVFALFAAGAIGSADLRPIQRIITPNGDGINDAATFGVGIDDVKIFDVHGRRVRSLAGPSPVWDGKDDDGKTVESGVYLYQYTSQGDRVSGVIAVAK